MRKILQITDIYSASTNSGLSRILIKQAATLHENELIGEVSIGFGKILCGHLFNNPCSIFPGQSPIYGCLTQQITKLCEYNTPLGQIY
jgi:hypothetical protein